MSCIPRLTRTNTPSLPPPARQNPRQATVGVSSLDYAQVLLQRTIVLTNIPTGTARVVFSELDLGNFLVHPLVTEAAKTAVQVRLVVPSGGGWLRESAWKERLVKANQNCRSPAASRAVSPSPPPTTPQTPTPPTP